MTFDFNLGEKSYMSLTRNLRDILGVRFSHRTPVTGGNSKRYLDINITMYEITLTVKIRMIDCYLVGFKANNESWFEFSDEEQAIAGSQILPFGLTYESNTLMNMSISQENFKTALTKLAEFTEDDCPNASTHLFLIAVVICEGARFRKLADLISSAIESKTRIVKINIVSYVLIKNWSKLSTKLLKRDSEGEGFPLPSLIGSMNFSNDEEGRKLKEELENISHIAYICEHMGLILVS